MQDTCCLSVDVGTGPRAEECYLSYSDNFTDPADFVCDATKNLAFYRKLVVVHLNFEQPYKLENSLIIEEELAAVISKTVGVAPATMVITLGAGQKANITSAHVSLRSESDRVGLELAVATGSIHFSLGGQTYQARLGAQSLPCIAGSVSVTGRGPMCHTCRAGTFSNKAQTSCLECPEGTNSQPAAKSVAECLPPAGTPTRNPFTVGDEWLGSFSDGLDAGQLLLQVIGASPTTVRFFVTMTHGNLCDRSLGCRNPGISQYYAVGSIINSTSSTIQATVWATFTDRSFGGYIGLGQGIISVNAAVASFAGTYDNSGTFHTIRRCAVADEVGTFQNGDSWIGHMVCDRTSAGSKAPPGTFDSRALAVQIEEVTDNGIVTALVDVYHNVTGLVQYTATGFFDESSTCHALTLTPEAWVTVRPTHFVSRILSGRLSEDGEYFTGSLSMDTRCACLGIAPPGMDEGRECGPSKWCYVNASCPDAQPSATQGYFHAPCSGFETCHTFTLARVCSEFAVLCQPGWRVYMNR